MLERYFRRTGSANTGNPLFASVDRCLRRYAQSHAHTASCRWNKNSRAEKSPRVQETRSSLSAQKEALQYILSCGDCSGGDEGKFSNPGNTTTLFLVLSQQLQLSINLIGLKSPLLINGVLTNQPTNPPSQSFLPKTDTRRQKQIRSESVSNQLLR